MVAITVATNVTIRTGAQGVQGPGGGNVNSPGSESSGNIAEFTGNNAIAETSLTTTSVAAHLVDTSNPHSVTAAQAGAEPDGAIATHAALPNVHHSEAHTLASHSDTTTTGPALDAHIASTLNPHSVTAAQAGADPAGTAVAEVGTHNADAGAHTALQLRSEKDSASGYAGLDGSTKLDGAQQTYGTIADTAAEGNDSRLSDSRVPTGSAGGDLGSTYPNPTVAALTTTTGPTSLTIGAVADGQTLVRSGSTIIGAAGGGNVTSPGGETAARITKFTGSSAIDETATTETELATAVTHSGIVTGNPHALDAADVGAEASGAIATHAALPNAHHNELHTIVSHSDTTATGAELDTLTDGSDADALHIHAIADAHIADMANPHGITGNEDLITGIISGGLVTVNGGDPALFDVAAGVGIIIDWSTPSTPVRTIVSFGPFIGEAVPNLLLAFTTLYINAAGALIKESGIVTTPTQRKILIRIQGVVHQDLTTITSISTDRGIGFQVTASIIDYINKLGGLNEDNRFFNASTNLTIAKTAGTTTLPFVNATVDTQDAATRVNPSVALFPIVPKIFRDGVGGFTFVFADTGINPSLYDNGSGTLVAVPNNRWTVKRFFFTGLSDAFIMAYGQATYANSSDAIAAITTENPETSPLLLTGQTILTTFLVVQQGATDLSDISESIFIDNTSITAGSGTGSIPGTWIGLLDTFNTTFVGSGGLVPMVDVSENCLVLTQLDHAAHLINVGINTHAQIDTHIADTVNPHATDIGNLGSGTLAELNTAVTDATLDDSSASRTPSLHALGGAEHSASTLAQLNALVSDATLDTSTASRPPEGTATGNVDMALFDITNVGFLEVEGTTPEIELFDTDADVDEGRWNTKIDDGNWDLIPMTDAGADLAFAIRVIRNGTSLTSINFGTRLNMGGNPLRQVSSIEIDSSSPFVTLRDTTRPLDEKGWNFQASAGEFRVVTLTDAGALADIAFCITRVGTTPTLCTIETDLTVTGNIAPTGTVDGRDVAADGTAQDTHIADTANPHGTDIGNLGSGTLAELNTAVTDATLDTSTASRPPSGTAAGSLTGTYPNPGVANGADGTAIHDNEAGEILAITLKATPGGTDVFVLEDVAAANVKKRTTAAAIAASGPPAAHASAHSDGGSDEIKLENLGATSTDASKVFGPDGSGGVEIKTPAVASVFGTELNLNEELTETSETSTTFKLKVRLPAGGDITMPAGTYRLEVSYGYRIDSTASGMVVRVRQSGSDLGIDFDHKNTPGNTQKYMVRQFTFVLTAANYNWDVFFNESGSGTSFMRDTQISIWRLL